jgi:DNA-binding LacI/PurR family transcriptional regulator
VHQPLAELGRAAVDQLHRQIELRLQGEEPEPPTVQWLFPSLKVRKSCGAAL